VAARGSCGEDLARGRDVLTTDEVQHDASLARGHVIARSVARVPGRSFSLDRSLALTRLFLAGVEAEGSRRRELPNL